MASAFNDSSLYQTKTPTDFWCKRKMNSESLIQPLETSSIELTRTHK